MSYTFSIDWKLYYDTGHKIIDNKYISNERWKLEYFSYLSSFEGGSLK